MWSTPHRVYDLNAHFQHSMEGLEMQKNESFEFVSLAGSTLKPHDGGLWKEAGSGSAEDAGSIGFLDDACSPFGSEQSYLPPLHLSSPSLLSSLDMSFLDADLLVPPPPASASSQGQPASSSSSSSCQLDSAMEDYAQTWRELVRGSSLLESTFFPLGQPHSAFSLDADPTPPLSFDFDLPVVVPAEGTMDTEKDPLALQIVAPKPVRIHNPAIQLAALVEDQEDTASSSQSHDKGHEAHDALEAAAQAYGYSAEQLQEYMSDSESSCDEEDFAEEEDEDEDTSPGLETFQFAFDDSHLPIASTSRFLATSPLSPLPPPETPLSPTTTYTVPQLSRVSQLLDSVRERRAARRGQAQGQGHARHYSVPDIHYRPQNWTDAPHSNALAPGATRRRQSRGNVSHSMDWSALALDGAMFSPIDAYSHPYPSIGQAYP